jgi:LacI family transcriptional regulator, galactose operon repressor
MKDIAQDLGISPMAVSKALRGHADIGAETKQRVLKRAAELNYRIDYVARSMVTGKTYLVGLVVPDLMQSYFAEIATAIEASFRPSGYHVVILHTGEDALEEVANIDLLTARKVDGLIIASAQADGRNLRRLKVPYVLIDRVFENLEANFVGCPDEDIGLLATEHLIEQGCRRIAHLRGPKLSTGEGRLRGFKKALARHKMRAPDAYIVEAGHEDASGYTAMQSLLGLAEQPDGVFCFNDPVAAGALRAIAEAGLSVPGEIAVIGAANMHYADMLAVPLSSIDQGTAQIGHKAAERLLACMSHPKKRAIERTLISPRLIVRASSRRNG